LAGSRFGKLRICYIAEAISIHTERWVNYFARRGHEVHLISRSFAGGFEGFDKRIQMHSLIKIVPLPQVSNVSIYLSSVAWVLQVRRLLKRIKPDILDAHFIGVPGYLGVASGFHPLVLTAWGSDILITPKQNPFYRFLTEQALRRADRMICVSPNLKEEMIGLGADHDKIEVIVMGIDTQEFSPALRNEALLQELHISDSPVVISTRSLRPIYDVETLIRAIPLVLQQIPQASFIIGGEGEQRAYLENLAKSLEVSDSIRFMGWISDNEFPRYLALSDVYVSTSLSDGTSVSLLEALSCELAPVVTDIPANRPWVTDGRNGFLIPVKDYRMLAERIVLLLKDSETRSRFGKLGRNIVVERAEYVSQMSKVEGIYEGLRGA